MERLPAAAFAALSLLTAPTSAAPDPLTLERALTVARERGPTLLAAAARADEAQGRLATARILLPENPVLEVSAGSRSGADGDSFEGGVGLSQRFELGGQRGARVAGARAGVGRTTAARDEALRRLLRSVAVAFYGALVAEERLRLVATAEGVAAEVERIATRRFQAQDVPVLDVNVGRAALARARAEREDAEAEREAALGELRGLLSLEPSEAIRIEGPLPSRREFAADELLGRTRSRADLRALEARLAEAEAVLRLARGEAWPDVAVGARYEREEGDDIVLGELALELPLVDRGSGRRAEAAAGVRRARLELAAARLAAENELRTALAVHARRAQAVAVLEAGALPLVDDNELLARRSYDAGELGLGELLVIRREALDTRRDYIDRLLASAVAAVEVEASAGGLE